MRTGRPTKQSSEFLQTTKEVLEDENVVYLTDSELLELINEKLPQDEQISDRTFRRWKAKANKGSQLGINEASNFYRLIRSAQAKQKLHLLKGITSGDRNWRRYAWILERKFDEWNLRKLSTDPELRKRVYWWKFY